MAFVFSGINSFLNTTKYNRSVNGDNGNRKWMNGWMVSARLTACTHLVWIRMQLLSGSHFVRPWLFGCLFYFNYVEYHVHQYSWFTTTFAILRSKMYVCVFVCLPPRKSLTPAIFRFDLVLVSTATPTNDSRLQIAKTQNNIDKKVNFHNNRRCINQTRFNTNGSRINCGLQYVAPHHSIELFNDWFRFTLRLMQTMSFVA